MTKDFKSNQAKMRRIDAYQRRQMFLKRMQYKLHSKEMRYRDSREHKFSGAHPRWTDLLEDDSSSEYGYR